MGQQYSHLSSEERILIEKLHCEQHLSVRKIAEEIGRDKSTVSRELRRGLWFASNENGSYRPYRPKRLKTGPWTSGSRSIRRWPRRGRRTCAGADPASRVAWTRTGFALGAGLAAQGVEPGTDRGTVEGPVRRRPVDADQPRVPLPVDLRQAAAGAGPAPVPGARQETPDEEKGRKAKGRASRCACHRGPARGGRIQEGFGHFESDTVVGAAPSRRCMNTQVERRSRRCLCSISCCGFSHDDFSGLGRACRPRNGLNWMVLVSPPERTGKDYDQHAPSTVYPSFAAERGIRRVDRAENTCQRADGA